MTVSDRISNMAEETSKEKEKENVFEKLTPVILFATIMLAFVVGILWQKVSKIENGGANVAGSEVLPSEPQAVNGKLGDDQAGQVASVTDADHIRGSIDAKVFVIEYSDFECPFCASFHPTAKQAIEEYGDDIAWIYRHFPLDTIHPNARPAAIASECVANLAGNDAFWIFADAVFENQTTTLTESGLKNAAAKAGVNGGEYDTCISGNTAKDLVEDSYQTGLEAGVTGTPGNFVMTNDGQVWVLPGAVPFESLKASIDEALSSI